MGSKTKWTAKCDVCGRNINDLLLDRQRKWRQAGSEQETARRGLFPSKQSVRSFVGGMCVCVDCK